MSAFHAICQLIVLSQLVAQPVVRKSFWEFFKKEMVKDSMVGQGDAIQKAKSIKKQAPNPWFFKVTKLHSSAGGFLGHIKAW